MQTTNPMFPILLLTICLSCFEKTTPVHPKEVPGENSFAVIELFTSEGCSSCPPADILLSEVGAKPHVIALSMHVDYWNRLGWTDPFSNAFFSDRQRKYGILMNLNGVYTPQTVINGQKEMVGSSESEVNEAIDEAFAQKPGTLIEADFSKNNASLSVNYQLSGQSKGLHLLAAITENNLATKVPRGENRGKTLRHDYVVRALKESEASAKGTIVLDIPEGIEIAQSDLVLFVQDPKTGKITGAWKKHL